MADPQVYLEKMSLFSRMLRLEGLIVSPQETADACQVLIGLGFEDRQQVKAALRTVFAKSRDDQAAFDRVFDGFFISEEAMRKQAQEFMEREQQQAQARAQAERELELNGQPMEFDRQQRDVYAAMPEEAKNKLRSFMDRYKDSAARNPDLYSNFIHSVFAKAILEQQMLMEDTVIGGEAMDPELGLLFRNITDFKDTEIPRAISIIQNISQKINAELSSKRKNRAHSGKLDFRRTIRKGLETGGTFYKLMFRKKRQKRRHLVLLCDVSGSMMQFSEFALRFIQSLNHIADSSRVFLFSEDVFEADPFSLQNMDLFRDFVGDSGLYGRGTDLGTALEKICAKQPAVLNDATTMLILSDTKTIDQPRAIRALLDAKRLAGQVLWLNPIPQSKWPYLRSIQAFQQVCTMVSCATLKDLADACRRLVEM